MPNAGDKIWFVDELINVNVVDSDIACSVTYRTSVCLELALHALDNVVSTHIITGDTIYDFPDEINDRVRCSYYSSFESCHIFWLQFMSPLQACI